MQYKLTSSPIYFSDAAFANILPDCCTIQSNYSILNEVVTSWTANIHTSIATNSTNAKL